MKLAFTIIAILAVVLTVGYLLIPKNSSYSAIVGQHFKKCSCLGKEVNTSSGDVASTACYGVVYNCSYTNGY